MRDDLKRQIFFKKRQTKKLSIKIIERQTAAAAEELSTTWEIKHRKSRIGIKTYVPKLWSSSSSSSLKIFITHKMIFWFANIHTLESKIKKERRRRRSNYEFTNTHTHTHILEYHFLRTRRMRTKCCGMRRTFPDATTTTIWKSRKESYMAKGKNGKFLKTYHGGWEMCIFSNHSSLLGNIFLCILQRRRRNSPLCQWFKKYLRISENFEISNWRYHA